MQQEFRKQKGMDLEEHRSCIGIEMSLGQEQEQAFSKLGKREDIGVDVGK